MSSWVSRPGTTGAAASGGRAVFGPVARTEARRSAASCAHGRPYWIGVRRAGMAPGQRRVGQGASTFFVKRVGGSGFVEGSVAGHDERDAGAVAGEAGEGLGVGFAAGSAAVVVGAGGGVVEGCERGGEHRAFELPVPVSGGVLAMDRGPRGFGGWGEAGVGGRVGGALEGAAVVGGGQEDGGGPDADAGHRGQGLGKRVGLQQGLDPGFQGSALFVDGGQRLGR